MANHRLPLEDGTVYSRRKGVYSLSSHSLEDYARIVGEEEIEKLRVLAQELKGIKILEFNSTAAGGGVAEMLYASVPFLNGLGIEVEWKVIKGTRSYHEVTKNIHNLLQGKGGSFTAEMERIYSSTVKENADANIIDWDPDVVFVHDPQPLGLAPYLKKKGETWFWRCHIDIEDTFAEGSALWDFITLWTNYYDALIFSAVHYIVSRWPLHSFVIPPFIDPLSEKNRELRPEEIDVVLEKHQIDPQIPIISQIGRFDPWKGIEQTIRTYGRVKRDMNCQLVLGGGLAADDPEGERILSQVCEKTKDDPDIHVLVLPLEDRLENYLEINALQRASRIILQPSIKEGFGLTVTEALFKEKPVIASPVGGISMQIRDGETGYFFETSGLSAQRIIFLLRNPTAAESMGRRGRRYVEEHFMLPSRVADCLRAIGDLKYGKRYPEGITSYHPWFKLSKRRQKEI